MLISHTSTHYHRRVPLQVGSHIINQVTNCITKEELKSLSQSWKLAYVSTVLSKSSQVSDQEFYLDQVKGKVVVTKKVIFPGFQTVIVRGLTKSLDIKNMSMCWWNCPLNTKNIHSQQYLRVNTRGIRGSSSTLRERYYFGTPH